MCYSEFRGVRVENTGGDGYMRRVLYCEDSINRDYGEG